MSESFHGYVYYMGSTSSFGYCKQSSKSTFIDLLKDVPRVQNIKKKIRNMLKCYMLLIGQRNHQMR